MSVVFHETYERYRISYLRNDRFAWIFAPGESLAMNDIPHTEKSGSRDELRVQAKVLIDAYIAERSKSE